MSANPDRGKAVVHVSGTLLRRNWYGQELTNCIVVRPSGDRRDSEGYLVHQVRFSGPAEMVFSVMPRDSGPSRGMLSAKPQGFIGTLPGFDNAIMVYMQADEELVEVQLKEGADFIPLNVFKDKAKAFGGIVIDPRLEDNC